LLGGSGPVGSPRAAQIVSDNVKNRLNISIDPFSNAAASLSNLSMFPAAGNDHGSMGDLPA
jgi:hypothetical protein